jgi:hypothetical protein
MISILLLGPSKWERGTHTAVPPELLARVAEGVKPSRAGGPWPIDARRALCGVVTRPDVITTVMEDWPSQGREGPSTKFRRIEQEAHITHYVIYWPNGGRLLGLTWELSDLAHRILDGKLDRQAVQFFIQRGVVGWDHVTEGYTFSEVENRTEYFEDLVALRCPIVTWEDYSDLVFALEHRQWA